MEPIPKEAFDELLEAPIVKNGRRLVETKSWHPIFVEARQIHTSL